MDKDTQREEKYVQVMVVRTSEKSALVEYVDASGMKQRTTVHANWVDSSGRIREAQLRKGIPFGIDWSELRLPGITPQALCKELRRRGIWTAQDARRDPRAVRDAVQKLYSPLVQTVMEFIIGK